MKKAIILGLLACSTLLVGCSNSKKTKEASKESKIVKSSSKKEASSEIKSSETTEQDNSKNTSTNSDESKKVQTEQDFNLDAIKNGDYSSAEGVWKTGTGDIFVINSDGTGTRGSLNYDVNDIPIIIKPDGNNSLMTVTNQTDLEKKLGRAGARVHFIKIGESDWTIENTESDKSRPRITIEQGDLSDADQIFYREN